MKEQQKLRIVLSAYDVGAIDEATKLLVNKLIQIKSNFINPIPLPVKRRFFSIPTAPNRHKYSQEQFERIIHRRVIFIKEAKKEEIETINKIKLPTTVNVRWINK